MFWLGCGPKTPDTAVGCTVAHDKHNLWIAGSSDEAMAMVANRVAEIGGGWVLVSGGKVLAEVRYEIGGLMTQRPAEELDAEMKKLYAAAKPSNGSTSPPSPRAGTRAFRSGCNSQRSPARPGAGFWSRPARPLRRAS
jgi:adenine deaminase